MSARPNAAAIVLIRATSWAKLGGLQLRHGEREQLQAVVAEIDLHPHVRALPFQVDDHAGAELGVGHVLPNAEAAHISLGSSQNAFRLPAEIRRKCLLLRKAQREPLQE